jgi:hypothetical protein
MRFPLKLALCLSTTVAAFWLMARTVAAYPTGGMSCSDIGDFAASVVVGKQNGHTLREALALVNKNTVGYPIERKNLTQIVRQIYVAPWAKDLSEEGARTAFTADCEVQAGD